MAASVAAMIASLASKLSLSKHDEPMDLDDLKCPSKGFVAPCFYLVKHLNTTKAMLFNLFRNAVRTMWQLLTPVEVQARGDRFLFTFTNERDVTRVKRGGHWCFQHTYDALVERLWWFFWHHGRVAELHMDLGWNPRSPYCAHDDGYCLTGGRDDWTYVEDWWTWNKPRYRAC